MKVPVLFLVFNRPEKTKLVLDKIRAYQPKYLYVAADGPRNKEEQIVVEKTRGLLESVDWDCQVKKLYRTENKGCRLAVSEAITWFFDHEEQGIILEDDCLPDLSFFNFCALLLEKYKDDERVMQICGTNYLKSPDLKYSYFFSKFGLIWGWATWRRAWKYYDEKMEIFDEIKEEKQLDFHFSNKKELEARINQFDTVFSGRIDTWDYQWSLIRLIQNGFSIIPAKNLVKNIGFDEEATHTVNLSEISNLDTQPIVNNLKHPEYIYKNMEFDNFVSELILRKPSFLSRIRSLIFP